MSSKRTSKSYKLRKNSNRFASKDAVSMDPQDRMLIELVRGAKGKSRIIFADNITPQDVNFASDEYLFVFGDNLAGTGRGKGSGQAEYGRPAKGKDRARKNTVGIVTKKTPRDFLSDDDFRDVVEFNNKSFQRLLRHLAADPKNRIVFPANGVGTGRAAPRGKTLADIAPRIANSIDNQIAALFSAALVPEKIELTAFQRLPSYSVKLFESQAEQIKEGKKQLLLTAHNENLDSATETTFRLIDPNGYLPSDTYVLNYLGNFNLEDAIFQLGGVTRMLHAFGILPSAEVFTMPSGGNTIPKDSADLKAFTDKLFPKLPRKMRTWANTAFDVFLVYNKENPVSVPPSIDKESYIKNQTYTFVVYPWIVNDPSFELSLQDVVDLAIEQYETLNAEGKIKQDRLEIILPYAYRDYDFSVPRNVKISISQEKPIVAPDASYLFFPDHYEESDDSQIGMLTVDQYRSTILPLKQIFAKKSEPVLAYAYAFDDSGWTELDQYGDFDVILPNREGELESKFLTDPTTLKELLSLGTVATLKALAAQYGLDAKGKKDALISRLVSQIESDLWDFKYQAEFLSSLTGKKHSNALEMLGIDSSAPAKGEPDSALLDDNLSQNYADICDEMELAEYQSLTFIPRNFAKFKSVGLSPSLLGQKSIEAAIKNLAWTRFPNYAKDRGEDLKNVCYYPIYYHFETPDEEIVFLGQMVYGFLEEDFETHPDLMDACRNYLLRYFPPLNYWNGLYPSDGAVQDKVFCVGIDREFYADSTSDKGEIDLVTAQELLEYYYAVYNLPLPTNFRSRKEQTIITESKDTIKEQKEKKQQRLEELKRASQTMVASQTKKKGLTREVYTEDIDLTESINIFEDLGDNWFDFKDTLDTLRGSFSVADIDSISKIPQATATIHQSLSKAGAWYNLNDKDSNIRKIRGIEQIIYSAQGKVINLVRSEKGINQTFSLLGSASTLLRGANTFNLNLSLSPEFDPDAVAEYLEVLEEVLEPSDERSIEKSLLIGGGDDPNEIFKYSNGNDPKCWLTSAVSSDFAFLINETNTSLKDMIEGVEVDLNKALTAVLLSHLLYGKHLFYISALPANDDTGMPDYVVEYLDVETGLYTVFEAFDPEFDIQALNRYIQPAEELGEKIGVTSKKKLKKVSAKKVQKASTLEELKADEAFFSKTFEQQQREKSPDDGKDLFDVPVQLRNEQDPFLRNSDMGSRLVILPCWDAKDVGFYFSSYGKNLPYEFRALAKDFVESWARNSAGAFNIYLNLLDQQAEMYGDEDSYPFISIIGMDRLPNGERLTLFDLINILTPSKEGITVAEVVASLIRDKRTPDGVFNLEANGLIPYFYEQGTDDSGKPSIRIALPHTFGSGLFISDANAPSENADPSINIFIPYMRASTPMFDTVESRRGTYQQAVYVPKEYDDEQDILKDVAVLKRVFKSAKRSFYETLGLDIETLDGNDYPMFDGELFEYAKFLIPADSLEPRDLKYLENDIEATFGSAEVQGDEEPLPAVAYLLTDFLNETDQELDYLDRDAFEYRSRLGEKPLIMEKDYLTYGLQAITGVGKELFLADTSWIDFEKEFYLLREEFDEKASKELDELMDAALAAKAKERNETVAELEKWKSFEKWRDNTYSRIRGDVYRNRPFLEPSDSARGQLRKAAKAFNLSSGTSAFHFIPQYAIGVNVNLNAKLDQPDSSGLAIDSRQFTIQDYFNNIYDPENPFTEVDWSGTAYPTSQFLFQYLVSKAITFKIGVPSLKQSTKKVRSKRQDSIIDVAIGLDMEKVEFKNVAGVDGIDLEFDDPNSLRKRLGYDVDTLNMVSVFSREDVSPANVTMSPGYYPWPLDTQENSLDWLYERYPFEEGLNSLATRVKSAYTRNLITSNTKVRRDLIAESDLVYKTNQGDRSNFLYAPIIPPVELNEPIRNVRGKSIRGTNAQSQYVYTALERMLKQFISTNESRFPIAFDYRFFEKFDSFYRRTSRGKVRQFQGEDCLINVVRTVLTSVGYPAIIFNLPSSRFIRNKKDEAIKLEKINQLKKQAISFSKKQLRKDDIVGGLLESKTNDDTIAFMMGIISSGAGPTATFTIGDIPEYMIQFRKPQVASVYEGMGLDVTDISIDSSPFAPWFFEIKEQNDKEVIGMRPLRFVPGSAVDLEYAGQVRRAKNNNVLSGLKPSMEAYDIISNSILDNAEALQSLELQEVDKGRIVDVDPEDNPFVSPLSEWELHNRKNKAYRKTKDEVIQRDQDVRKREMAYYTDRIVQVRGLMTSYLRAFNAFAKAIIKYANNAKLPDYTLPQGLDDEKYNDYLDKLRRQTVNAMPSNLRQGLTNVLSARGISKSPFYNTFVTMKDLDRDLVDSDYEDLSSDIMPYEQKVEYLDLKQEFLGSMSDIVQKINSSIDNPFFLTDVLFLSSLEEWLLDQQDNLVEEDRFVAESQRDFQKLMDETLQERTQALDMPERPRGSAPRLTLLAITRDGTCFEVKRLRGNLVRVNEYPCYIASDPFNPMNLKLGSVLTPTSAKTQLFKIAENAFGEYHPKIREISQMDRKKQNAETAKFLGEVLGDKGFTRDEKIMKGDDPRRKVSVALTHFGNRFRRLDEKDKKDYYTNSLSMNRYLDTLLKREARQGLRSRPPQMRVVLDERGPGYSLVEDFIDLKRAVELDNDRDGDTYWAISRDVPVNWGQKDVIFREGPQSGPAFYVRDENGDPAVLPLRVYETQQYILARKWEDIINAYLATKKGKQTGSSFETCILYPSLMDMEASIGGQGLLDIAANRASGIRQRREESARAAQTKRERDATDEDLLMGRVDSESCEIANQAMNFYNNEDFKGMLRNRNSMERFRILLSGISFIIRSNHRERGDDNFILDNELVERDMDVRNFGWNDLLKGFRDANNRDALMLFTKSDQDLTDYMILSELEPYDFSIIPKVRRDINARDKMFFHLDNILEFFFMEKVLSTKGFKNAKYPPLHQTSENESFLSVLMSNTGLKDGSGIPIRFIDFLNQGVPFPIEKVEGRSRSLARTFKLLEEDIKVLNECMLYFLETMLPIYDKNICTEK